MAILDKIASVFFDDPDDQAGAIIHAVSVEMGTVGFLQRKYLVTNLLLKELKLKWYADSQKFIKFDWIGHKL